MNLDNFIDALDASFALFDQYVGKNYVLAIGPTGCGKSTLFGSMIVGSENMHLKKLTLQIDKDEDDNRSSVKSPSKTKKYVIDYKEGVEQSFKIGHTHQSQTFYPDFYEHAEGNFYFVDVAGLIDTNGPKIQLIQHMILKKLFNIAKSV